MKKHYFGACFAAMFPCDMGNDRASSGLLRIGVFLPGTSNFSPAIPWMTVLLSLRV